MKKKLTFPVGRITYLKTQVSLLLVFLMLLSSSLQAQTVQLGSPETSTSGIPLHYNYNYNYSQSIYNQSELIAAGVTQAPATITKIRYKTNAPVSTEKWRDWVIYMGNTTKSTFSSVSDFIPVAELIEVFNGQIVNQTTNGWFEIVLDTPFEWNGTDNLVIAVDENTPGYGNDPYFRVYAPSAPNGSKTVYYYQDGGNILPTNPTAASYKYTSSNVPHIQLDGILQPPCSTTPEAGMTSIISSTCADVALELKAVDYTLNGSGLTGKWQKRTPSGSGNWEDIPNATYPIFNLAGGINTPTDFRFILSCGTLSDTTNVHTVNLNSYTACFCTPVGALNNTDEIRNFMLGSFSHPTPGSQGSAGYANYSDTVAPIEIIIGQSYTPSLTSGFGSGNHGAAVWIDYNDNGIFENSERVSTKDNISGGTTASLSSFVAQNAPGLHRLRVQYTFNVSGSALDPCLIQSQYAETEDYMVHVVCPANLPTVQSTNAGICSGTTVSFTSETTYPFTTITWWDAETGGNLLGTGLNFTSSALVATTSFYLQQELGGVCPTSARTEVVAIVTPVTVTLEPIHVLCNGLSSGSFEVVDIECGVEPLEFSLDNGTTFGPIPTDLTAGNYTIIVRDANMGTSIPYELIISQPASISNLAFVSSTLSTATVSWTTEGTETSWNIEFGPAGFTPGTGINVVATNNPFVITGLDLATNYEFYIQPGCTPNAAWSGPKAFSTKNTYINWDNQCGPGFIDISTTGELHDIGDDGEFGVTLPFSFRYQNTTHNKFTVGNNGGIILGTTTAQVPGSFGNMNSLSGDQLVPWGDDLDDETGELYYELVGTAPDRIVIVQWENVNNFSNGSGTITFQVQIHESSDEIYFIYEDVIFGGSESADDYAGNADIGISGDVDINISNDNQTYLKNNSCVRFFYADCPKVAGIANSTITVNSATIDWNSSIYGETNWTVILGLAGFDPSNPAEVLGNFNTTSSDIMFTNMLDQLTTYDMYIYTECTLDNLTSEGFLYRFTTKANCADISNLTGSGLEDAFKLTWNWTPSELLIPVDSFRVAYGMTGFGLYSSEGIIVTANGTNYADTITDPTLIASGVYDVYVQAMCAGGDTSNFVGPIKVTIKATNDAVCEKEHLELDRTYIFNNASATIGTGENAIAPPATGSQTTTGWINSTLNGTLWYAFTAPQSGSVRLNSTAINYNGQAAVYKVDDCSDYATFTLIAANDDAIGGGSNAPNFTICGLTPGSTYYILFDKYNSTSGDFSIHLSEIVLDAGTANPLTSICNGSTIDLNTTVNTLDNSGIWISSSAPVQAAISGSMFNTSGFANQIFNFQYRIMEGCAYDSVITQIKIVASPNAGDDGVIMVCKNQPFDLLSGLSADADVNGTWYNSANAVITNTQMMAPNLTGQYNYTYIASNGVCPNDTAQFTVNVQSSCNWLSIEEELLEEITVYPNPTAGLVQIVVPASDFVLTIYDANGRKIGEEKNLVKNTSNSIDLNEVERGVYFFHISTNNVSKVIRVIKQ